MTLKTNNIDIRLLKVAKKDSIFNQANYFRQIYDLNKN